MIYLYSNETDVVICEKCFTKNVSIKNLNAYEMINLEELETLPRCEVCLISKESEKV